MRRGGGARNAHSRGGGSGGGGGHGGAGGSGAGAAASAVDVDAVDLSVVRGIYAAEEETDEDFKTVPKFVDAAASKAFYTASRIRCTNPQPRKYPECKHIYTHLVDWQQVTRFLLAKAEEYRTKFPVHDPVPLDEKNAYFNEPAITEGLEYRLNLSFHSNLCEESTLNTLRYGGCGRLTGVCRSPARHTGVFSWLCTRACQ